MIAIEVNTTQDGQKRRAEQSMNLMVSETARKKEMSFYFQLTSILEGCDATIELLPLAVPV
jgi:hypothetical protein